MTAPRDPSTLDEFDAAVRELVEQGGGPSEIARALSEHYGTPIARSRVRRSIARLKRLDAFSGRGPEDDAPSLEAIDLALARAIQTGDSASAARWARTRASYLESRAAAAEVEVEEAKPAEEVEHWDRLSDWQVQVMTALVHLLHDDELTSFDHEALAKLEGQGAIALPTCQGCYFACAPKHCLCPTCLEQFRDLRAGKSIPGAVGLAPLPSSFGAPR